MQAGDTLKSLARRVYGNEAYWYVLADANGLDEGSALVAGSTLTVPEVRTSLNDANTFKPYNPADVTGPTTPSLPYIPPAAAACNPIATIIMAVVAIAVTVYTAGAAATAFSGATSALGSAGAAAAGGFSAVGGAALTGAATIGTSGIALGAGAAFGGAVVGGFAGSVASQLVGKAAGWVDSFSLRSAVASGIGAGLTAGLAGKLGGSTAQLMESGASAAKIAGSALGNAVGSYVAGKIAGVQDTSFSWKAVAASAVGSLLTAKANQALGLNAESAFGGTGQIGQDVVGGLVGGVVSLHTRRAAGFDDPVNYGQILADAFGNALGNEAVRGLEGRSGANRTKSSGATLAETVKSGSGADKANKFVWAGAQASSAAVELVEDSATGVASHVGGQQFGNDGGGGGGGGVPQSGSTTSGGEPIYWYDNDGVMHIGPAVTGHRSAQDGGLSRMFDSQLERMAGKLEDLRRLGRDNIENSSSAVEAGVAAGSYAVNEVTTAALSGLVEFARLGTNRERRREFFEGLVEFSRDPIHGISQSWSAWSGLTNEERLRRGGAALAGLAGPATIGRVGLTDRYGVHVTPGRYTLPERVSMPDAPAPRIIDGYEGVLAEVNRNADIAVELTRRAVERGRISGSAQAFGTRAHLLFERLNNRLNQRLITLESDFRVFAEVFRDKVGGEVPKRSAGSIGADLEIRNIRDPKFVKVFDLKTYESKQTPISSTRQIEFMRRIGAEAKEIYRQR